MEFDIPFNKPYLAGPEMDYMQEAVNSLKLSGNGKFSQKCHQFFCEQYGFRKCLLTTSCTDALEMAALLLNLGPEDEVILPSFTFVSTANAFVLRGASLRFADSLSENPNISPASIESLIGPKTKAIVVVHYAGMACPMNEILALGKAHRIPVIEDAAQAIDNVYVDQNGPRFLGGLGVLSAFSFHETKNISSGEGGMLAINDQTYEDRAEILWEKGTNRSAFFRGEVDKYGWVDLGSSFLPSELTAAFLYGQLEHLKQIQDHRLKLWQLYHEALAPLEQAGYLKRMQVPEYSGNNAHMYYLLCRSAKERTELAAFLKSKRILAVTHYLSLHASPFFSPKHDGRDLPESDRYTQTLLRLPLYMDLKEEELLKVCAQIDAFFKA